MHVLERMAAAATFRASDVQRQYEAPLGLVAERPAGLESYRYPVLHDVRRSRTREQFGTKATFEEAACEVDTTVDPRLQKLGQDAVDWGMQRASAEGIGAHQAALVAIRPSTGEIVAMIGGRGFTLANQFNRAWQARRQPGSSFKPYVYTAAIDNGYPPTATIRRTLRSRIRWATASAWRPMDDDFRYLGAITLRYALAQSRATSLPSNSPSASASTA